MNCPSIEPFDEAKYQRLMDGLEAVEISASQLFFDNDSCRFDSEYFMKKYLIEEANMKKFNNLPIGDFCFITDGQHGYHEIDENSNISHLTAKNVKNWFADNFDADKLAKWVDDNNKRSSLQVDDIIISTRGTIGCCAIVKEDILPANIDQDIARVCVDRNSNVLPEFLLCYVNSRYGQDWIFRNKSGMVQQGIPLSRIKDMPIPIVNEKLQKAIEAIIDESYSYQMKSHSEYFDAEELVLTELGFSGWEPSYENKTTKWLSESYSIWGRLDAEFYLPKYDEIESKLSNCSYISRRLGDIFSQIKDGFNKVKEFYNYIEIGDINVSNGISSYTSIPVGALPDNAKIKVIKGDLLYSTVRPYRGAVSIINTDVEDLIVSGAFVVLRESGILNKETLFVLLRSRVYREYIIKFNAGTSYPTVREETVLNLPIPILSPTIQTNIKSSIDLSIGLLKKSKYYIDSAAKSIEIAIEQGENTAIEYLNKVRGGINHA